MAYRLPAGLFLTGRDAAILDHAVRLGVRQIATVNAVVPRELVELAEEIHRKAGEFRTSVLATAGSGTDHDTGGSDRRSSIVTERLTVRSAARIANASESYLRRLARRGVLHGTRGPGGGWVLDGDSVAAWMAARNRDEAA